MQQNLSPMLFCSGTDCHLCVSLQLQNREPTNGREEGDWCTTVGFKARWAIDRFLTSSRNCKNASNGPHGYFTNLFYWSTDIIETWRTHTCCACFILSCLSNFSPKERIMLQHTSQIHNDNCNLLSSHWALRICFNTNWVSIAFLPWEKSVCKPFNPQDVRCCSIWLLSCANLWFCFNLIHHFGYKILCREVTQSHFKAFCKQKGALIQYNRVD